MGTSRGICIIAFSFEAFRMCTDEVWTVLVEGLNTGKGDGKS
jgi:hypothetical protein